MCANCFIYFTTGYQKSLKMKASQSKGLARGAYYMIICKATEQALRIQQSNPTNQQSSRVIGSKINAQDNSQIFMMERLDEYSNDYQIVACASDYVLEAGGDREVTLQNGNKGKNQKFHLVAIPDYPDSELHKYYCIRSSNRPEYSLALEGSLRASSYDPNSQIQQFRFQEVNNYTIQNSCLLVNNYSGKVLDVPQASEKNGERIVIWDRNNRWNQRWYFEKAGSFFYIKNLVSNLCLDIAGESRDNGAKVVQWPPTGGNNQLWTIQEAGHKIYKIWSCHAPSLCLCIRKQEGASGSYLEVGEYENPTMYWRIEGSLPK